MNDTERLETLEFKLAHLERGLQELSDVVFRQQQDIERVLLAHRRLAEQLAQLSDASGDDPPRDEKPPHY